MNRRKKIKSILTKKAKQANLKANPKKSKPKYISKAERAKLEEAEQNAPVEIEEPTADTQP
ncbi:DUF2986 domain-containing protein [Marinomonas epiphytica]